jgi:hypothetical protein
LHSSNAAAASYKRILLYEIIGVQTEEIDIPLQIEVLYHPGHDGLHQFMKVGYRGGFNRFNGTAFVEYEEDLDWISSGIYNSFK